MTLITRGKVMQNNIYPNMTSNPSYQFPFEHTKQGQQQLKERMKNGSNPYPNQDQMVNISSSPSSTSFDQPVQTQNTQKNGNMLSSLMPLLSTMNNPNANMNDMLKLFAPYVNQSGLPVTDLIKLMNQMSQNTKSQSDQKNNTPITSTTCHIDQYDRVN